MQSLRHNVDSLLLDHSDQTDQSSTKNRGKKRVRQWLVRLVKWLAPITLILLPALLFILHNQDAVMVFLDFVRDREAVSAYLDEIGFIGPLVLMGLVGIQVLIPTLPAEPPMIAGGYAYGFVDAFLISWLATVVVTQAVFLLARWAGQPLVGKFVPEEILDKWTRIAGERGTVFFLLAFVIPPVPSDIMVYVAGLSAIDSKRFFVANLFGRIPMVALFTLVGANGFSITPTFLFWLTFLGIIMLIAWWHFIARERASVVEAAV
jgi:uncharacterized membrane protein YdjX (TVP38/TMEM64 family)